jgi:hypothetical protein
MVGGGESCPSDIGLDYCVEAKLHGHLRSCEARGLPLPSQTNSNRVRRTGRTWRLTRLCTSITDSGYDGGIPSLGFTGMVDISNEQLRSAITGTDLVDGKVQASGCCGSSSLEAEAQFGYG